MKRPLETRERRLRRRHDLDGVRGNVLFSYDCRILNLSDRGMAVRTHVALAPGRSYSVKIQHGDRIIPLNGTVAWCRLQGTEKNDSGESVAVYSAGIELTEPLADRPDEILPLLEQRGVARLERRLLGRLVPRGTVLAPGEPPPPATIREISHTGMVAEAPFLPQRGDLLDLELAVDEAAMRATVRVLRSRSLGERDGLGWAEITLEYAEMTPAAQARLDRLIRDELGLEPAPPPAAP